MDADLQHDETLLPKMLETLTSGSCDLVTGSRFASSATHSLSSFRQSVSEAGIYLANRFLPTPLSDPMTGFFMLRRDVFEKSQPFLSPMGFKILFDIVVAYPATGLRIKELPFHFRERHAGESKLDAGVFWEFLMYLVERLLGRRIPAKFISFSIVGAFGVLFHLSIVKTLLSFASLSFLRSHLAATAITIALNFFLNNTLTYRSSRLRGWGILKGFMSFYAVCSIGAIANVGVAAFLHRQIAPHWVLSAVAGIIVGTFWNYGMSKFLTWGRS
jgi:dolichol-phosphate mannosyltransferase